MCEALVTSVELDGDKATGVNFVHGGSNHTVKIDREVIVSCGALQSPQILELSGIGDPDVLKAAGVECKIVNKAVGENFQDHVFTAVGWELNEGTPTLEMIYDPDVMAAAQEQLVEEAAGPLTHISSTQGFFPYKLFATEEEQAEIIKSIEDSMTGASEYRKKQYETIIAHLKDDKSANLQLVLIAAQAGWDNAVHDQSQVFPPPKEGQLPGITAALCLQYPASRGSVHIKSADPSEHPAINPGYLSHPADAAVLAAGVKVSTADIPVIQMRLIEC